LWILFSDLLLDFTIRDVKLLLQLHTIKGWAFVLVTSALLHYLIRQGLRSIQESHSLLQSAIEGTADAIFVKDLQGRYLLVNSTMARILGKTAAEAIGKDDTNFFPPDVARKMRETDCEIIRTGQTQNLEKVVNINNTKRVYLSTKYVCRDRRGNIIGLMGMARDITDRQQAEAALRETNQTLQALIEAAPLCINVIDRAGKILMWNPAAERIFGWTAEEVLGRSFPAVSDGKSGEFETILKTVSEGGAYAGLETKGNRKNGEPIDISLFAAPMRDAEGSIVATMGMIADISDRKRMEAEREQLLEEQARLIASLQRETEDLTALSIVTANSVSTLNLEELLNVFLQRIAAVMLADTAVILLTDGDLSGDSSGVTSGELADDVNGKNPSKTTFSNFSVRASIGIKEEDISAFNTCTGSGFAGTIAATKKPLYVEDARVDLRASTPAIERQGIRTMLGVPLKRNDMLVGVLQVNWYSIHPYSDRELHLLEITAERCAMAIINAKLYEETKELHDRLKLQIERMPIGCIFFNSDFRVQEWNPAATQIFGFSETEVIGTEVDRIISEPNRTNFKTNLRRIASGEITVSSVEENIDKSGIKRICEWHSTPIVKTDSTLYGVVSMVQDITERQQVERQLWQYAFYHPLTKLPNRTLLLNRLAKWVQRELQGEGKLFALLYLDLSRFKIVKYSMGHHTSNQLLVAVAERLQACQSSIHLHNCKINTVAHVEADEFAILLENASHETEAIAIAEIVQKQLSAPFDLNGCEVFTDSTIGVVLSSFNCQQAEELLQAADTAMNQAKVSGNQRYAVFNTAMQKRAVSRLQLDAELRRALENQEFEVYYQPILSLLTKKITGFEALARWRHPQRGFVSPSEFIPLAEETGSIVPLGAWVLEKACRQLVSWQQIFPANSSLSVSVNLSAVQLIQPGIVAQIDEILEQTGVNPENLKLEITETAVMENAEWASDVLGQFKERRIRLSIDDFGTGYSSFSYLHSFPFDTLKIDRSFVRRMIVDAKNLEIIRTIVMLAHKLGMEVIAEGIETTDQMQQLKALECECGQGYLFSQAIESEAAKRLLAFQLSLV
jgi:PAS domain S-box-containing protein/diguanylate cyclase (GGDEF)-like protein